MYISKEYLNTCKILSKNYKIRMEKVVFSCLISDVFANVSTKLSSKDYRT